MQGGESLPVPMPSVASHYRLSRRLIDDALWRELHASLTTVDLTPLLGRRGVRCFTEALDAFRHGLYLATANLAGAASEAAWYTLASHLATSGPAVAKAFVAEDTVWVIQRTGERLRQVPNQKIAVTELLAQAAFLRDFRNYGLHPRPQQRPTARARSRRRAALTVLQS